MSAKLAAYLLLALVVATDAKDDISECKRVCDEKFVGTDSEKKACAVGCDGRKALSQNVFGFHVCTNGCNTEFANETEEAGERNACKFACSLPFVSRLTMSIDMTGKEPHMKVHKEEGLGISQLFDNASDDLSDVLLPSHLFGVADKSSKGGEKSNEVTISRGDPLAREMERMQSQMDQLVNNMLREVMQQFKPRRELLMSNGVKTRPHGHDQIALTGMQVGNGDINNPIITEFDNGPVDAHRETAARISQSMRWLVLTFALLFLVISVLCVAIFFRRPGVEEYIRMRYHFARQEGTAAESLPVKKSMITDEPMSTSSWEHRQPAGDAPPAYDQVSIHSAKKANN